jgi:hypothetical protein
MTFDPSSNIVVANTSIPSTALLLLTKKATTPKTTINTVSPLVWTGGSNITFPSIQGKWKVSVSISTNFTATTSATLTSDIRFKPVANPSQIILCNIFNGLFKNTQSIGRPLVYACFSWVDYVDFSVVSSSLNNFSYTPEFYFESDGGSSTFNIDYQITFEQVSF